MKKTAKYSSQRDFADIKRYLSAQMSSDEQHAFEAKMLEDPFLQDAVEGYSMHPDFGWDKLSSKQKTFKYGHFIFAGITIALAVIVYLNITPNKVSFIQDFQIPVVPLPQSGAEVETTIEKVEEVRSSDSSVSVVFSQNHPVAVIDNPEKFIQQLDAQTLEPIAAIPAVKANKVPLPVNEVAKPEKSAEGQKIYHVRDYKVFDYRGIRTSIEKTEPNLGGTPASGHMDMDNEPIPVTQKISYVNYLEQAITFFSQSKYNRASEYFEQILKTYPDDLNALFYGALCDFNSKEYTKAIEKFELANQHNIPLFAEESLWYKAKSMYASNRKTEAIAIMKKIASQDGFYKEQAGEFLKSADISGD